MDQISSPDFLRIFPDEQDTLQIVVDGQILVQEAARLKEWSAIPIANSDVHELIDLIGKLVSLESRKLSE